MRTPRLLHPSPGRRAHYQHTLKGEQEGTSPGKGSTGVCVSRKADRALRCNRKTCVPVLAFMVTFVGPNFPRCKVRGPKLGPQSLGLWGGMWFRAQALGGYQAGQRQLGLQSLGFRKNHYPIQPSLGTLLTGSLLFNLITKCHPNAIYSAFSPETCLFISHFKWVAHDPVVGALFCNSFGEF